AGCGNSTASSVAARNRSRVGGDMLAATKGLSMTARDASRPESWPSLPLEAWSDTYATLHRWMQIVGKIRLTQSPWVNHSWHVTSYVTATGLTTSAIPYQNRSFQIDFDFIDHKLIVRTSEGR